MSCYLPWVVPDHDSPGRKHYRERAAEPQVPALRSVGMRGESPSEREVAELKPSFITLGGLEGS
jgi:hypothetical protein